MPDIIQPNTPAPEAQAVTQGENRPETQPLNPKTDAYRIQNIQSLKGFFNLETINLDEEAALDYIYDTFEEVGVRDTTEMLLQLKDIGSRLGMVPAGESRVIAVKNYIKILNQINELSKVKSSLER